MTLTLAVTCDAWHKQIWQSLVEPQERRRWWSPDITLDPQVGGGFEDCWKDDNGTPQFTVGEVVECEPQGRISLSWRDSTWESEQNSLLTLTFVGDEGRTRIELTHKPLKGFTATQWEATKAELLPAWTELLFSLRNHHHRCTLPSRHDIVLDQTFDMELTEALAQWTTPELLTEWLGESDQRCLVIPSQKNHELLIQWRGPAQHPAMAIAGSTLVHVQFSAKGHQTQVHLEHTGFGVDLPWKNARDWHLMVWKSGWRRLASL